MTKKLPSTVVRGISSRAYELAYTPALKNILVAGAKGIDHRFIPAERPHHFLPADRFFHDPIQLSEMFLEFLEAFAGIFGDKLGEPEHDRDDQPARPAPASGPG